MGRYLTPPKVTLLVLIRVYTEGAVPLSECTEVLSFLFKHISPSIAQDARNAQEFSATLPISEFEVRLSNCASSIPGRSIWDLLLKSLWSIDCSAALDAFVEALLGLLAKSRDQLLHERDSGELSDQPSGKILRTSPLGVFIRRCHLEYTRLHFQDSTLLWQDLISYRHQTRTGSERKTGIIDGRNLIDVNFAELNIDSTHPIARIMLDRLSQPEQQAKASLSAIDIEKLLEFQVSEMQRLGGRLPEDMHKRLKEMSIKGAALPKLAYYIKFLDSWRAGDYSSAFDNLHRYFDYTMRSGDRTFYQYALLNLAILQADFGCHAEAIPAMQEAIATARENRDTVCLNFCMSWLYHFGRAFPVQVKHLRENGVLSSEVEGLTFLKSRARDAEMWSLLSTSLLCEARSGLQHGDSLANVFENIVKASQINNIKYVHHVIGPALLTKGSVFGRIGLTHMARVCGDLFLQCHSNEAPIEDVLKCHCRLSSLLVQQGRYDESEENMASIPEHILKVLKFQNSWTFYSNLLRLQRLLHRDDLSAASNILRKLKGQGSPDIECNFALGFLEIDLYTRKGNLAEALCVIEKLADRIQVENNDVLARTKLVILKAELWSRSGHAMKAFSLVMRAANLAYRSRLLPALWEAICALVIIFHELQEFTASKHLLEAVIPQILECQDCYLAARAYSLLADTNLALAGLEESNAKRRKEYMTRAMEFTDAAFEQFKFVEDLNGQLQMLARKGKIEHFSGDLVLANDTASRYLDVRNEYIASRN